jgi:uncharacterized membrane protein required for colicin V production
VEFLTELNWIDLLILILLAGGVFLGWTQGLVRYALSTFSVIVSFVVAAQLKGPLTDALGFWTAFNPPLRELWIFIVLYAGITVGLWFAVRALYRTTRLPIIRQLDELGGAVFGLLFAIVVIVFGLVVLDTFFQTAPPAAAGEAGWLHGLYQTMNDSILVEVFRQTVIPTAGWLARPFVPSEIAEFLRLP